MNSSAFAWSRRIPVPVPLAAQLEQGPRDARMQQRLAEGQTALAQARRECNTWGETIALHNVGTPYKGLGQQTEALRHLGRTFRYMALLALVSRAELPACEKERRAAPDIPSRAAVQSATRATLRNSDVPAAPAAARLQAGAAALALYCQSLGKTWPGYSYGGAWLPAEVRELGSMVSCSDGSVSARVAPTPALRSWILLPGSRITLGHSSCSRCSMRGLARPARRRPGSSPGSSSTRASRRWLIWRSSTA